MRLVIITTTTIASIHAKVVNKKLKILIPLTSLTIVLLGIKEQIVPGIFKPTYINK